MSYNFKVITDYKDLEGLTIKEVIKGVNFIPTTLILSDNKLIQIYTDCENCNADMYPPLESEVKKNIEYSPKLQKELSDRGLLDLDKYLEELENEKLKKSQEINRKQYVKDLKEFNRLKEKYNNFNNKPHNITINKINE